MHESSDETRDPRIGSVLQERYYIEAFLGRGGMGAVYRALQRPIDRAVAIKLISAAFKHNASEIAQRFRREAAAMAKLRHPNTVRLYDFGVTADNELFMVMELLDGVDLGQHLHTHGALEVFPALSVVRDALGSLSEAHACGIVHRDIKPANIFLSRMHDDQIMAKLMDFGVAYIEQSADTPKITVAGAVMGTPAYLSPEQALGKAPDARSDLYSLGVTLFQMLTGRTPFEADSVASQLIAHISQPVPRLAETCPKRQFSADLQAFLDSLLSKDPERRLRSAKEALLSVEILLQSEQRGASTRQASWGTLPSTARFQAPSTPRPVAIPRTMLATLNQSHFAGTRSRRVWGPLVAACALLCGSAGYWFYVRSESVEEGLKPEPRKPSVAEMTPVRAPAEPARAGPPMALRTEARDEPDTHTVLVRSLPSEASVFDGDKELGKTPYSVKVGASLRVTLKVTNHKPYVLELTAESPSDVTVRLEAVARTQPRPSGRPIELATAPPLSASIPTPDDDIPPPPPEPSELPPRSALQVPTANQAAVVQPTSPVARLAQTPRKERKIAMAASGTPYSSVAAVTRAYQNHVIDRALHDDIVWALKVRRKEAIRSEKEAYRRGSNTKAQYSFSVQRIDRAYLGD